MGETMHTHTLYVSATTENYRPGKTATMADVMTAVAHALPAGLILTDVHHARGVWNGVSERTVILDVNAASDAAPYEMAASLARLLGQECVLVVTPEVVREVLTTTATPTAYTQRDGIGQPRYVYGGGTLVDSHGERLDALAAA